MRPRARRDAGMWIWPPFLRLQHELWNASKMRAENSLENGFQKGGLEWQDGAPT